MPSYTNTGYARGSSLLITRGNYSHTYDLLASFTYGGTTYPTLSGTDFARLSDNDYGTRRDAFIAYVYSLEHGLQADCPDMTVGSVEYNTTMCPLKNVIEE